MRYEYLLELRSYYYADNKQLLFLGEDIKCWGEDEYDALNKRIESVLKKYEGENIKFYFKLSQLRPTGRSQSYPYNKNEPFFETNTRPYIKGLISRFMVRFLVSNTLKELEGYKIEFDEYLEKYKDEFTKDMIRRILNQYYIQRDKINTGIIRPLPFNLDLQYTSNDAKDVVRHHSEHVFKILKAFGFRVHKSGENYIVRKPIYYYYCDNISTNIDYDDDTQILSPVELILYWERGYKEWTLPSERRNYKLNEKKVSVLEFLGYAFTEDDLMVSCKSLIKANITPFYYQTDLGGFQLWVIALEGKKAKDILTKIRAELYDTATYDYNPLYNAPRSSNSRKSGGLCVFCGSPTYSDTLCPECSDNVD